MENNLIKQAWELAEHDTDYQNYQENMMLLEGRSGEYFTNVIMKRVKLKNTKIQYKYEYGVQVNGKWEIKLSLPKVYETREIIS